METVRAYIGQAVSLRMCGGYASHVTSPGVPARSLSGGEAGNCSSCDLSPLSFTNSSVTRDYAVSETSCGAPEAVVEHQPAGWAGDVPTVACYSDCSTDHVYGGTVASPSEFMVSIQIPAGTQFCGGTMIAPGVVLTAGHCVDEMPARVGCRDKNQCVSVLVGATNVMAGLAGGPPLGAREARMYLEYGAWLLHPQYNSAGNINNDVAILYVTGDAHAATRQYSLGPWSVPAVPATLPVNAELAVLGWGYTSDVEARQNQRRNIK